MNVNPVHLRDCLSKVDMLTEAYNLNTWPNDPYRSIDHLVNLYNGIQHWPTTLQELPIPAASSALWGMFVKNEDGSMIIVYAEGLDLDWKRFVICKELMHGLLDTDGYRDMNIEAHVNAMAFTFPDDDSRPPVTVQVEFLAEIAAMQFLLPYKVRCSAAGNDLDPKKLASQYGVPLKLVEVYCSPSYMSHLDMEKIKAMASRP